MTAGIFAQHGVWVGKSRPGNDYNAKGFFENQDIKNYLKRQFGTLRQFKEVYDPGFKQFVLDLNPTGKWLVKHGALYWTAWRDFDPIYLLIRRNIDSVYASCQDVRFQHKMEFLQACIEQMDYVEKHHGGINVYTEDIIKGDYHNLKNVMAACGIEMDKNKVDKFVEPRLWRH